MDIRTKTMGTITIADDHIIDIPDGLFGFEEYKRFALFDSEYEPLMWLQSLDEVNLAFLVIDPFLICNNYELDVDDATLSSIGIRKPADVHVMVIVTVPSDGRPVTADLQGPLVINRTNKKAMQTILSDTRWTTKFDILAALKNREENKC
ncbi:MAG: flagellar assembly protein FliW [Treponema sp.]|nr:flagellar assembly protein FliW [Treponema sp.]